MRKLRAEIRRAAIILLCIFVPACVFAPIAAVILSGCVTSDSTVRQIERQLRYLDAAQKVYESAHDALLEAGERIEQGKVDLKALQEQRAKELEQQKAGG